jgi:hypothetical protein
MIESLTFVAPYVIANGTTAFVLSKMSEKKIIARFNNAETIKTTKVKEKPIVPEEIKDLVSIIEKNVDKEYLDNLYTNLSNVKIKKKLLLLLLGVKGKYSSQNNILDYSLKGSLEHELIHLASAHYDKENDICQSGFVHYGKGFNLCKALNEGYTDLTARRLFNKKTSFYDGEVRLAQFFELLFDKKELQKYYFTNDLVSFVNKLSTFIGREEAIKMLLKFDLGHNLKKLTNPAYKIIYTDLELKLSEIFMNSKKPIDKQFDHFHLLDESPITNAIKKIKKR